jgi:hypothetical protein
MTTMKLLNKKIWAAVGFCIIIPFISCKKLIEIPLPKTQVTTPEVFADSVNASLAVTGIYSNIMGTLTASTPYSGYITIYTGLSSDELKSTTSNVDEIPFYLNHLQAKSGYTGFWQNSYIMLYQVNACIEGISNGGIQSSAFKNQLLGECKLLRAFFYFHLVNLYGAVPLITSTDYRINAVAQRSSVDLVYGQIIKDLLDAQQLMPADYPANGRVRPNKFAATALLAKAYLYHGEWAKAEAAANDVINAGIYQLENDLNSVFLSASDEAIWQWLPVRAGYETPEGTSFNPATVTTKPRYVISSFLFNAFEVNDQRKIKWINTITISAVVYNYPYKYKLGHDNNSMPLENYMLFRLGEQYLIRAEARAQQNHLADAIADLNIIRNRAGLLNTTAATQADLLTAIYHERQVELFAEWGNRWYDLKRTGLINTVMSTVTPVKGGTWDPNSQLYPVPFAQIQLNPFLTQNPGY